MSLGFCGRKAGGEALNQKYHLYAQFSKWKALRPNALATKKYLKKSK